jgi:predicted transglutaminase-like cysteine proteinase
MLPLITIFSILYLCTAPNLYASDQLDLEVITIRESNPSYSQFCQRWPNECEIAGPEIITWTKKLALELIEVNTNVNRDIIFTLDPDQYDQDEFWNLPLAGRGDCEDNALEKRRRLAQMGYPTAALRIGTAFHSTKFYAHALLLVETTNGTYILDQDSQEVLLWNKTPYIFESRIRPDGRWERFAQDW